MNGRWRKRGNAICSTYGTCALIRLGWPRFSRQSCSIMSPPMPGGDDGRLLRYRSLHSLQCSSFKGGRYFFADNRGHVIRRRTAAVWSAADVHFINFRDQRTSALGRYCLSCTEYGNAATGCTEAHSG